VCEASGLCFLRALFSGGIAKGSRTRASTTTIGSEGWLSPTTSAPFDQSFEPLIFYEVIGNRQTENARRENAPLLLGLGGVKYSSPEFVGG
jgi:hypothetical protein